MKARLVVVALLLGMVAACGTGDGDSTAATDGWRRVAAPPFEPRQGPVTAWTGSEAVVVGGDTGPVCPPNADCARPAEYARDGAAYDPSANTWRPIAEAPTGIPDQAQRAVVDGVVYVLVGDALLAYDVAADAWQTHPAPVKLDWSGLTAHDGRLVLAWGSDEQVTRPDRVFDPANGRWSTLPDDPLGPSFDRSVTSTPYGLLLTAKELVDNPGSETPSVLNAALLVDGSWQRLPDSDQLGGCCLAWTGTRVVDPTIGGADGGEVNGYGRTVPYGGMLDLPSKSWHALPNPPSEPGGWAAYAHSGHLFANSGYVYDDRSESWTRIRRPRGAPEQSGSAVWMGDRLLVVGGVDWRGAKGTRSPDAWVLEP